MPAGSVRKCYICRHPSGRRKYCARHLRIARAVRGERAACLEALRRSWSETANGHLCEYVHILLDETDILEVTANWVNGMKADMTLEGFRAFVRELARVFRTGEEFDITVLGI